MGGRRAHEPGSGGEAGGSPLRKAIESHSRQLNLTRLLKERKKVRAIPMETLEQIMCEAIANVILNGDFDPLLDHESLREQTKTELRRLIRDHQEGRTTGERHDRDALLKQVDQLKDELEKQKTELRSERAMTPEEVQEREIDRLQRRITKLNGALSASENALRELAKAKSIDPGVASLYSDFQGLAQDDAKFREKREMIQVVFVNNLRLMKREVTADDLEGVDQQYLIQSPSGSAPSTPATPSRTEPSAAPSRPTGRNRLTFRKPVEPSIDETSF